VPTVPGIPNLTFEALNVGKREPTVYCTKGHSETRLRVYPLNPLTHYLAALSTVRK